MRLQKKRLKFSHLKEIGLEENQIGETIWQVNIYNLSVVSSGEHDGNFVGWKQNTEQKTWKSFNSLKCCYTFYTVKVT